MFQHHGCGNNKLTLLDRRVEIGQGLANGLLGGDLAFERLGLGGMVAEQSQHQTS
jgi:hypothetical protein